MNCRRCHSCGGPIREVLDGEEWCDNCCRYQRPATHGWRQGEEAFTRCWTPDLIAKITQERS